MTSLSSWSARYSSGSESRALSAGDSRSRYTESRVSAIPRARVVLPAWRGPRSATAGYSESRPQSFPWIRRAIILAIMDFHAGFARLCAVPEHPYDACGWSGRHCPQQHPTPDLASALRCRSRRRQIASGPALLRHPRHRPARMLRSPVNSAGEAIRPVLGWAEHAARQAPWAGGGAPHAAPAPASGQRRIRNLER